MSDKEKMGFVVDIKTLFVSMMIGLGLLFVLCFMFAFLIKRNILPFNYADVYSKASLMIAVLCACSYGAKRGRGEAFLNSLISAVLMFALGILIALGFPEKEWDTAGAVICLLICCLSCFLALLQNMKNSKLHKRRRRK